MDVAKSGLFKQKGLTSKCKALENEIRGLRVTTRTHVTMWEAKAMQLLKAERKRSLKDDLTNLKGELHESADMTEQDVAPAALAEVDR
eukprot:5537047-Pyramimonas_sp.AAC.1